MDPEDDSQQMQVVEGVPLAIVVTVGPGVLVSGLPVGRSVTAFLGQGCAHSITIQAMFRLQALIIEAMKQANEAIDKAREEAVSGEDSSNFVA